VGLGSAVGVAAGVEVAHAAAGAASAISIAMLRFTGALLSVGALCVLGITRECRWPSFRELQYVLQVFEPVLLDGSVGLSLLHYPS
jgi:hypothetical protein